MLAIHRKSNTTLEYQGTLNTARLVGKGIIRMVPVEVFKKNFIASGVMGSKEAPPPLGVDQLVEDIGIEIKEAMKAIEEAPANITRSPRKKKEPTEKKAPKKGKRDTGSVSLKDICSELGIDPSKARRILRKKLDNQGRWEWSDPEIIKKVKNILK